METTRYSRKWCYEQQQYIYHRHNTPEEIDMTSKTLVRFPDQEAITRGSLIRIIDSAIHHRTNLLLKDGSFGERQSRRFLIRTAINFGDLPTWELQPKSRGRMKREIDLLIKLTTFN